MSTFHLDSGKSSGLHTSEDLGVGVMNHFQHIIKASASSSDVGNTGFG